MRPHRQVTASQDRGSVMLQPVYRRVQRKALLQASDTQWILPLAVSRN